MGMTMGDSNYRLLKTYEDFLPYFGKGIQVSYDGKNWTWKTLKAVGSPYDKFPIIAICNGESREFLAWSYARVKIQSFETPVFPRDYNAKCRFSNNRIEWVDGVLKGFNEEIECPYWSTVGSFKYAELLPEGEKTKEP